MNLDEFLSRLKNVKRSGAGHSARCPSHDDQQNSLSVTCENDKILVHCHAGCLPESVCGALGLSMSDLFIEPAKKERQRIKHEFVCAYDYRDEHGNLLYQNCRYLDTYDDGSTDKSFSLRHFEDGKEIWGLNGTRRVPYGLPELKEALAEKPTRFVILVEGEKDVDNLRTLGFAATSLKNWKVDFNPFIKSANVVLLIDHDRPGVKQALDAAKLIIDGVASLKVISLYENEPLLEKHGRDVSDWLAENHTAEELRDIIKLVPEFKKDSGFLGFSIYENPENPENPKSASNKSYRFTTLDELLVEPEEETAFIWEDLLPVGGFSICSAKPKVGKSTFARNLAVAIMRGETFLGRETVQGKVLYLCLEEKRAEIAKHFRMMKASGPDILIHTGTTPEKGLEALAIAVAEHAPVLVVIDPLSRVLRANDFNDYASMARGLEPFVDLARKYETHLLALHHDSKGDRDGGDSILGSTALFGAVDCHISMKKRESGRTISTENRYGVNLPETVIQLSTETGTITPDGELSTVVLRALKTRILAEIGDKEALTEGDIKERVGGSKGIVSKAIRELFDENSLVRSGEGKRGNPYIYCKNLENPTNLINPENLENLENPTQNTGFSDNGSELKNDNFSENEKPTNDVDKQRAETLFSDSRFVGFPIYEKPRNLENLKTEKPLPEVYECPNKNCHADIPFDDNVCPSCQKSAYDF